MSPAAFADPVRTFWSRTIKQGPCILWTGATMGKGYGAFRGYAHRWIYEQALGPQAKGKVVMHSCDTPGCVALQHLSVGSTSMNHLDAFNKGRKRRDGHIDIGSKFGRWVVIAQADSIRKRGTCWRCRCECGGEKVVRGTQLRTGKSRSCGCLLQEYLNRGKKS